MRFAPRLAHGLPADSAGLSRLRERVAASDEREALLDLLADLGARKLLEEVAP